MFSKRELRKKMLDQRSQLSEKEILKNSKIIVEKVQTLIEGRVGIFYPIRNEVNLLSIDGEVAFPRVIEGMEFYKYTGELVKGKYNIPEPTGAKTEVDTIIVPGSVFDSYGYRIGYGGGYYDKYMKEHHLKIGVCFDFQVIDELPKEVHDVRLDWLVTEKRILEYKE